MNDWLKAPPPLELEYQPFNRQRRLGADHPLLRRETPQPSILPKQDGDDGSLQQQYPELTGLMNGAEFDNG